MSYAYDVQSAVWHRHICPHVKDEKLVMLFEMLMEDMHNANHRVPSANGVFRGDGVNKDPQVTKSARKLDEYVKELKDGDAGS